MPRPKTLYSGSISEVKGGLVDLSMVPSIAKIDRNTGRERIRNHYEVFTGSRLGTMGSVHCIVGSGNAFFCGGK